jgi:protein-disulfide isomerase
MTTPLGYATGRLAVPVDDSDHVRGAADASVTVVEYGDYQCPFCGRAHPAVRELLRLRPSTVRLVYRHFPLTNVHPYAEVAAEFAEAAGARQQFWPMHDWLFENQELIEPRSLLRAAEAFGLDVESVEREVTDDRYLDRIRRDFVGGVRSGVNGTPTFFVNGVRHDLGYSVPELLAAVDEAAAAWPTDRPRSQQPQQ